MAVLLVFGRVPILPGRCRAGLSGLDLRHGHAGWRGSPVPFLQGVAQADDAHRMVRHRQSQFRVLRGQSPRPIHASRCRLRCLNDQRHNDYGQRRNEPLNTCLHRKSPLCSEQKTIRFVLASIIPRHPPHRILRPPGSQRPAAISLGVQTTATTLPQKNSRLRRLAGAEYAVADLIAAPSATHAFVQSEKADQSAEKWREDGANARQSATSDCGSNRNSRPCQSVEFP